MRIKIGNRLVGKGQSCFIIAEAGVNHNGDIALAKKLVDVAKESGADAVKFQTFKAEEVVTKNAKKIKYQAESTGVEESQFEMLKKLELSKRDFKELFDYAQKKEMLFLSTPDDKGSVDLLDTLGVASFKIGSGEITNFPLLKHIARKAKPIILSTGTATLEEVKEALEVIQKEGLKEVVLLHCVTAYPAKIEDMNLRAMATLRNIFKLPVGLSDHTLGITIPIAATALGACVIEKHLTLDKNFPGPDHKASLEPAELKKMIEAIRDVEKASGDGVKRPTASEEKIKKLIRRSIVAKIDISKGEYISQDMLDMKRPGTGISPKYLKRLVGRKAKKDIQKDQILTWEVVS